MNAAERRRLAFAGAHNFRDIGGYPIGSGGRVREGQVFRADALCDLTDADLVVFAALGLRAVYDLRSERERADEPNRVASSHVPMGAGLPADQRPDLATLIVRADGERWLAAEYRWRVTHDAPVIGQLFMRLARPDGRPAVFHCAGGKDRTGLVSALLLSWLGVDRATVLDDYELTAQWRTIDTEPTLFNRLHAAGMSPDAIAGFLDAPRAVMEGALEQVDREHGGIETYLTGPAAVRRDTLDELRDALIE